MPLEPCRECGTSVSTESESCPACGTVAPTQRISADFMPCKHCKSIKTQRIGAGVVGFACLLAGSCLIWIPIIGWVLAPVLFLLGVVIWLMALIPKGAYTYRCSECNKWFTVKKTDIPREIKPDQENT